MREKLKAIERELRFGCVRPFQAPLDSNGNQTLVWNGCDFYLLERRPEAANASGIDVCSEETCANAFETLMTIYRSVKR